MCALLRRPFDKLVLVRSGFISMSKSICPHGCLCCLRLSLVAPSFRSDIGSHTNTNSKGSRITSWSPCPSSAARDWEVIPSEAEPRGRNTDQASEDEVKSMMSEVSETRAGNIDSGADWDQDEDKSPDGRCSGLIANGNDSAFLCIARR
jgi:hypothetical protein